MEPHVLPLSALKIGERAAVVRLGAKGAIRRRLLDLGITQGVQVECLHRSPLGDPAAYAVRGAVVALRDCDSACVAVVPVL